MESIKRLEQAEAGKRDVYHHPRIEGLVVRVTENGTKSFCFAARPKGGEMVRKTFGVYPKMTVDEAERMAKALQASLAKGEVPRRRLETKGTLGELVDWYISKPGIRKESTNAYYRYLARDYLKPLAKRDVGAVRRGDIADLHLSVTQKHGGTVANRLIAVIRASYQEAIKVERFDGPNPAANLTMNRERSRENRLLASQIPPMLDAIERYPDARIRAFFMLAFLTGQRKSNILAMRWDDVYVEDRRWIIPETKNGRPQSVPLGDYEIEILEKRKQEQGQARSPWVFPSSGQTGHLVEVKAAWRKILKESGLKPGELRVHDIRRTYGSIMAEQGTNTAVIGTALGHKSRGATWVYERPNPDSVAEAKLRTHDVMMRGRGGSPKLP